MIEKADHCRKQRVIEELDWDRQGACATGSRGGESNRGAMRSGQGNATRERAFAVFEARRRDCGMVRTPGVASVENDIAVTLA